MQVIHEELMQLPQEHAHRMATHETIARDVRRQRQIHGSDHGDITQFTRMMDKFFSKKMEQW